MEFSQDSTQVVQDMGNVELIELRTSKIHQCPSCGHAVFRETILCTGGKHIRPNLEVIQCINAAFEILRAPWISYQESKRRKSLCRKESGTVLSMEGTRTIF